MQAAAVRAKAQPAFQPELEEAEGLPAPAVKVVDASGSQQPGACMLSGAAFEGAGCRAWGSTSMPFAPAALTPGGGGGDVSP